LAGAIVSSTTGGDRDEMWLVRCGLRGDLEAVARIPQAFEQRKKWAKGARGLSRPRQTSWAPSSPDLEAKRLYKRTELEDAVEALEITVPQKAK
jgi:hypothetical protein